MTDRPKGQRFSFTYVSQGEPVNDTYTMRYRLGKLMANEKYHPRVYPTSTSRTRYPKDTKLYQALEAELGTQFRTFVDGKGYHSWVKYYQKVSLFKLLDSITVLHKVMSEWEVSHDFASEVNRIFREENIAFQVDDQGGAHPLIDSAYDTVKQSVILGMSDTRYAHSLYRINEIDACLMADPPNYIHAIRAVFGANENLFKLMFKSPRLDKKTAIDKIGKQLQATYADHPTMQRVSAQVLQSFGSWIEGAHHYRHEEGVENPSQPDEELGILMVSEGMSFIRWLVAIDQKMQS